MGKKERERRRMMERQGGAEIAPLSADALAAGSDAPLLEPPPLQARPVTQTQAKGSILQYTEQRIEYSGPLPHPAILKGYNDIVAGSADRILQQFEEQGRHRRKQEERVVSHNIRGSTLGQVFAFVLFMTIIVGGGLLIDRGKDIAGAAAIVSAVVGSAYVLHGAKKAKQGDLETKKEAGKKVARRK